MTVGLTDPNWPKLLSLTAHEFRSPLTVVAGYIRMLLKDRAGPLNDQQRRLLEEAEKSCGRLSTLIAEVSEVAHLESGTSSLNRTSVDVRTLLEKVIGALPPLPDRSSTVNLTGDRTVGSVQGDASRLSAAFASIITAIRREVVAGDELTVHLQSDGATGGVRITIAEPNRIDSLAAAPPSQLTLFDEWRGGNGLALATARRIVEAHGGRVWSPSNDEQAGAVLTIPVG
jgi:signal transduction histidine kinase